MSHSFAKYAAKRADSHGVPLHWGLSDAHGAPYRGAAPPMLTSDEQEKRLVEIKEFKHKRFNMADPEDAAHFDSIMDRAVNGWYLLTYVKRFIDGKFEHYLEWVERFTEDVDQIRAGQFVTQDALSRDMGELSSGYPGSEE